MVKQTKEERRESSRKCMAAKRARLQKEGGKAQTAALAKDAKRKRKERRQLKRKGLVLTHAKKLINKRNFYK